MDVFTLVDPYFHKEVVNCAEIARNTGINERQVQRLYASFKREGQMPKKAVMGRPRKIDPKINSQIARIVCEKAHTSSENIASRLKISKKCNISSREVRRRLNKMGYSKKKGKAVPFLTLAHIEKRLQFYQNCSELGWNSVIFSDESAFQLCPNIVKFWSKNDGEKTVPTPKFDKKVMVWGAISSAGKSQLSFVTDSLNSDGYQKIISKLLMPFIKRKHRNFLYFQQDNAPCHVSSASRAFLAQKKIPLLEWPPNSPDLNPIENLWGLLKIKAAERFPANLDKLKEVLVDEWNKLPIDYIQTLIFSMTHRMEKLKKSNGRAINY
jgi:transposase